jgi:hypothetical protein
MRATPRRLILGAAGALAIAILAARPPRSGTTRPSEQAQATEPSVATHSSESIAAPGLDPEMLSAASLREALAAYERDSVYPPTSHLWTEQTAGERQPWNRSFPVEHLLDDRPGQETMFRLAGDRHHVEAGESLTSTLEVVAHGERLPITIHSALVEAAGQGRTGIELVFRDDGEGGDAIAGDRIYTNRFVPSAHDALVMARRVRLQVDLEAAGVERLANLDFTYTPRPLLRLDDVSTAAREGSLVSTLQLEVYEPGAYQFDADVYAADGVTQIGWITDSWHELAAGPAKLDLVLFGKVLRDRGIAGPFVIRNIRAERRSTDDEVEMFWSDPGTYATRAFALEAFSTDPWDGQERSEALAAMRQAIDEQERAEALALRP